MKNIPLTEPISVTLRAGDWLWLLGLLSREFNNGENAVLDKLYDQVKGAIE